MAGVEHPVRPNRPVLPFGVPNAQASFIDPTVHIRQGLRITIGRLTYIAPYVNLDARGGGITIGSSSAVLDNALLAPAAGQVATELPIVRIGEATLIATGASILGASTIGAVGPAAQPTYVGPNAVVESATVEPGAFISAGARVAQAIVIRAGVKVQPGAAVTTQGEADDPSLGKVTAVTAADLALTRSLLAQSIGLTTGYTLLYQGNSSTGPNPGTTVSGVFNGNLAAVSGASRNPARPATPFPSTAPKFVGPHRPIVPAALSLFRARVIGGVVFGQRADAIASRVGRGVSIRADVGQPIRIGSIARMGNNVTIHAPQGGTLSIGSNLSAGERAAILGGPAATIGDNVTIGAGAVISGSTVGSGAVVGDNAVLINTTILPGEVVPPGTVRVG